MFIGFVVIGETDFWLTEQTLSCRPILSLLCSLVTNYFGEAVLIPIACCARG